MRKWRDAGALVLGSCAVYGIVAACESRELSRQRVGDVTEAGVAALTDAVAVLGGETGTSARREGGTVLPGVPDAVAQTGTESVSATCDIVVATQSPGFDLLYAEAAFPGRSVAELAHAVALLDYSGSPETQRPPGFDIVAASVFVRDGAVAVGCGSDGTSIGGARSVAGVRFLLP